MSDACRDANDLKPKGASGIERLLQDAQEVLISLRGKPRYDFPRECEIAAAWPQTRADLAAGRCRRGAAGAHGNPAPCP